MDEEKIYSTFKRRECSQFIPVSSDKSEKECKCGYTLSNHSDTTKKNQVSSQTEWNYKKHSEQKPTDAFGDIEFVGYGENISKFVRVDVDTDMRDILNLMEKGWGLDKPNILISVTGGAKDYKMNKRLKETLRRGLMNTALTTGAWIVTGGTYAGVMKDIGEAVKDFRVASTVKNPIICIGVATWGCIQNRDALTDKKEMVSYKMERKQKQEESSLDPNHTHFILVDNATQHKYAVEIPFRASLEKEIAKNGTDKGEESVPVVLLVFNGGPGTLETVHESIQNNIPTVIVKGSGRVADILAYAFEHADENEIEHTDQEGKKQMRTCRSMNDLLRKKVKDMVKDEFKSDDDIHIDRIKDCLKKCDFISLFELESKSGDKEIDVVTLQAILKANKNDVMKQLHLALEWNRIDVAKCDIFTDDKIWLTDSLDEAMLSAIQLDRTDFIDLFLEHGVRLSKFLKKARLHQLYKEIPDNCLLKTLLKSKADDILSNVGALIQTLMGDLFRPLYRTEQMSPERRRRESSRPSDYTVYHLNATDNLVPSRDLFIWSVLMARQDMAKLFWTEGKDAIAAALVAHSILRAMEEKTKDTELKIRLQSNMNEWSDLAVGLLNECYSTDERKAQDLLVRELSNWDHTTCMLIAFKANNKDFISQTACQSLLNRIWMGKLAQDNSSWRLMLCVLFPPLALVLLKFQCKDKDAIERNYSKQDQTGNSKPAFDQPSATESEHTRTGKRHNRICNFFNAPVIIFMYNVFSYLIFLGLFTYVLIFNFNPSVSTAEIILMGWVFTIFLEEIRQVVFKVSNSRSEKLKNYIKDIAWNIVDIATITVFVIGIILRLLPYAATFEAARIVLALNFVSFALRLLHIFSVQKELGPKLIMIGEMLQNLMHFLIILVVFVISYAIASHSILYPNSPFRWSTAIDVIRKSYWNIYGELFLEEIVNGAEDCTYNEMLWTNGSLPRCPTETGMVIVPLLMGVYMLLANILLLNLLIAMFSYTFALVQDNTDKHWSFQRYSLVYGYYTRPVLYTPLIVFCHVYLLVRHVYNRCCDRNPNDNGNDFCLKNKGGLVQWEHVVADAFHQKRKLKDAENNLLKTLADRIDEIQQQQPKLERRLEDLEKLIETKHESLMEIMLLVYQENISRGSKQPVVRQK